MTRCKGKNCCRCGALSPTGLAARGAARPVWGHGSEASAKSRAGSAAKEIAPQRDGGGRDEA